MKQCILGIVAHVPDVSEGQGNSPSSTSEASNLEAAMQRKYPNHADLD